MFYIGDWDKQKIVDYYITNNDVKRVLIIYSKQLRHEYIIDMDCRYVEIHETKNHGIHYDLLQYVNKHTLIVLDNLLISQQRYSNEYNCIANFVNQTPHRIVFNLLPFIENADDFMILLDFYNKVKYKGERFNYDYLKDFKYFVKPFQISVEFVDVSVSDDDRRQYNEYRDKLFNEIGLKNPKLIPNNLSALCGDIRYRKVNYNKLTSRNKRFPNLTTYKDSEINPILDLPTNRKDFIELLTKTKARDITILTSNLTIDKWYKRDYIEWLERLQEFYDKAEFFRH